MNRAEKRKLNKTLNKSAIVFDEAGKDAHTLPGSQATRIVKYADGTSKLFDEHYWGIFGEGIKTNLLDKGLAKMTRL